MASVVPVVGETFTFGISAVSQGDTNIFQAAATIAAGDFQRSINGGAFSNLDNLPTVAPAAGKRIQIVVSAAETTTAGAGGEIYIAASDQAGGEWQDLAVTLRVFAANLDSLATLAICTEARLTNLDAAVSSRAVAGDLMGLANDAITLSKFDESTAFPLVASDAGATQVARVGADSDTLETLSDQLDLQATLAICTDARLGELDAANLPADVDSILSETSEIGVAGAGLTALGDARLGNLDAAVTTRAVAGDLMGLVDDAITLSKFDESTAFPLVASDAGVTQVARVGADGDTLKTLSDQIDGVSTLDAAGVRTAVGLAAANLDAQLGALPTDAENADAVWDEALAGHAVVGSAGAALAAAGSAGDPWATPLPGAYVAGTAGYLMGVNLDVPLSTCCSHGAGAITFVYTLTNSVDGTPIDNADVWVTTDIAGANVIASGVTDLAGQVTFYLDPGTLYFWRQCDGWTFDNPDTEVVV